MSVVAYQSKATMKEAEELLAEKFAFNAGSLTAKMEYIDLGEPAPIYAYVVRSYGVAIAIHGSDSFADEYFKHIRFDAYDHSVTTSKHANMVKRAWRLDN
jgi:hypothetical protein